MNVIESCLYIQLNYSFFNEENYYTNYQRFGFMAI